MEAEIDYKEFVPEEHLSGVAGICSSLDWDNVHYIPDLARRSLTSPVEPWRRRGVARRPVNEGFQRLGAERMDLTSSDEALNFTGLSRTGSRLYSPGSRARQEV